MSCSYSPLNGLPFGGNTEGGRLDRKAEACVRERIINNVADICIPAVYPKTVQAVITPASGNRTADLALGCSRSKGVTAERVQQLLAASLIAINYSSGTSRILELEQKTISCNPAPATPIPIIAQVCPPLPPVPGPPYVCKPSRFARN